MKSCETIEEFFEEHQERNTDLQFLVSIIEETELLAAIKWGAPKYTVNRKNVISLASFKQYK